MTKSMTNHWLPMRAISFLILLATMPLYAQEPIQVPPVQTQPVQQLEPGTQPPATPSAPLQTAPVQPAPAQVQPGQAPQTLVPSSPANDAARYLAGLPVAYG